MKNTVIKKSIVIIIVSIFSIFSCSDSSKDKIKTLDLMSYGVPIKVKAPEGTEVKTKDMGIYKDITLKKGEDYFIQIISTEATTNDISKIKAERLNEVKANPYFSKVVLDEDNGFVFEKKINDTTFNYDFRLIKLQGDQEYSFQTGLYGLFSKELTMDMYNSVK